MTTEVSVSREIAAAPDRVWAMLADVTRMSEWSPETIETRWLRGVDAPAVGAKFQGTNENGSKRWKSVATITALEPMRRFEFRVTAGPLKVADWVYTIEPSENGCVLTEAWTDRRGWFMKRVSPLVTGVRDRAAHNRAGMTETLQRLAAVAESDDRPSSPTG